MDLGAAIIGLLSAFVVKVAVLFFAARLLFRVYRATSPQPPKKLWLLLPKENVPEIQILKWSLVFFFLSELTCGVEVYILFQSSSILTGFHSFASGIGMALFALGLYLYLDKKLLRYGEAACHLNRICKGCTLRAGEGCRYTHLILYVGTFLVLAAFCCWFASVETTYATTQQFLLPFPKLNLWYDSVVIPWLKAHIPNYQPNSNAFYFPRSAFVIEFRILPALSALLSAFGIILVLRQREATGLKLLVFSLGLLCYTYFELILYRATGDILLGSLMHEIAEFWFLVATAEFLRQSLAPPQAARREGG